MINEKQKNFIKELAEDLDNKLSSLVNETKRQSKAIDAVNKVQLLLEREKLIPKDCDTYLIENIERSNLFLLYKAEIAKDIEIYVNNVMEAVSIDLKH